MTHINGDPGEEPGDRQVYQALSTLSDDFIIYAQKKLVRGSKERNPDYVIVHPDLGVIVLEVKDWIKIEKIDEKHAWVYRSSNGRIEQETSPVEQARGAALILASKLEDDLALRNYAGKLNFPYRYAGVLPQLPMSTITWLEKAWGEGAVLGKNHLNPDKLRENIEQIPTPFFAPMTMRELNAVRAILDPCLRISNRGNGAFKGVYDLEQEAIARERIGNQADLPSMGQLESSGNEKTSQTSFITGTTPSVLNRLGRLENTTPEEVKELREPGYIRLVRGFAGTGKTDVLILRAHYIKQQYPDKKILVTTFNRPLLDERLIPELTDLADVYSFDALCSSVFQKKHGTWVLPQSTEGVVARLAISNPLVEEFGQRFLAEEIIWIKENQLNSRQKYLNTHREGRAGMSRHLSRKQKAQVFDLFDCYQDELHAISPHDWPDLHEKVLRELNDDTEPDKQYDVILVDEAQHFAPTWIRILRHFLKPDGALFLCDDPSQSVYRLFSWRQRGIEVVGRTRWLRVPYRNTRQIFEAAFSLIVANPLARKMMEESEDFILPDLENDHLRDGELPQVYHFKNTVDEKEFIQGKVADLIKSGLLPSEIAIMHTQKHVIHSYHDAAQKGILVDDLRRRTGMEFPAVIIPRVQDLVDRDTQYSWEDDQARQQLTFYMAMTRARDHLYLLYEQKWPKPFEPIQSKVVWHVN